ncbi:hypothetical protein [Actinoplanes sp. NPDC023714]|uniref:hypothetical protein n=1 Tax=Actinoplanes sp. NPDC023714 TaxID=3154322 RepID=UPI0033F0E78C
MRVALIVSGALIIGYGVSGALADLDADPLGMLVFALAVLLLHDLVLMPLILLTGSLIRRTVSPGWRSTVRLVLLVDLAVLLVGAPLALGFGRDPGDPSVLPRPYGMGLLLIVVAVSVTGLACRKGIERWRAGRRRRPSR